MLHRSAFVALFLLGTACAGPAPETAPVPATGPRGHLLIVGGGEQPIELVRHFVELAGGLGEARIAVLPMASAYAEEGGREKVEQFRSLGADAFMMNLTRAQAQTDSAARLLAGATGIWFPGGDQARLTSALLGTQVLAAIHRRYREGAVVGGTSAGAAIMSDTMITGNQFRAGEDTAGYYGDEFPRVARRTIEIRPGLGFLPGAIVDQHFIKRERHNRLLSAVLEHPDRVGVGIDESTAVQVNPDGSWMILGRSAAEVIDAREARITAPGAPVLGATGVHLFLLPAGSTFDPRTGEATLPGTALAPAG